MKGGCVLISKVPVDVREVEVIRFYDFYIIIPHSSLQAHGFAERYWMSKYPVYDIENVKKALRIYVEKVGEEPEAISVNKPVFSILDGGEIVIEKTRDYEIRYYSGTGQEGYVIRVGNDYVDIATALPL